MVWVWMRLAAASDGGNQKHPIAFLERAGFAAEEANVFLIEIDVEELADLALIVTDVAREIGIAGRKFIQCVGDRGCATVYFWDAFGEAAEGGWDFDGYGHFYISFADFNLRFCAGRGNAKLRVEIGLKCFEARRYRLCRSEFGGDRVGRLQAVAGDADDGGFVRLDAILADEFLRDSGGHTAGSLGENALCFGEQLDGPDDLRIGNIFGPAAGFADQFHGKGAVGRIADGQRACDGIRLLWLEAREVALHAIGNGRAARGLRAEKLHRLRLDPSERDQFAERLCDLGDERTAGHRHDDVIRQGPAKLFGDFVAVRFRAFGIVRAQIHVDEAPLKAVGDLRAKAIDVIIVAVDAHDARSVNRGVEHLGGLEVGRNEHAGVEALLRRLRGDSVGKVAGRRAADGGEVETTGGRKSCRHDAIFKGKRWEADSIVFEINVLQAPFPGELARGH